MLLSSLLSNNPEPAKSLLKDSVLKSAFTRFHRKILGKTK